MKNKIRNQPCICGSGIKTKKCCKGKIKTEKIFDYEKWYDVTMKTLEDNKELLLEQMINQQFIDLYEEGNQTFNKIGGEGMIMGDIKIKNYNLLLLRLVTSFLNHQIRGVLPFSNYEVKSVIKDDYVGDIIIYPSLFETNLSEDEKEYIINSIVDFYKRLHILITKLHLHLKKGGIKDYRTQKIDIERTNVFSCFDDFTYYMIEWFYDNIDLLKKFLYDEVIGELIRKFYLTLGKPKNRVELKNNTIKKLLNLVRNDEGLLKGFRTEITGRIINEENSPNSLKNGENGKYLNQILDKFPHLNELFDESIFRSMVSGSLVYNTFYTDHYYGDKKINSDIKSRRHNVDWLNRLNDDDMVSLYRGVSDKNYPMGWSWTLNKSLGLRWIRSRGLVEDGGWFKKSVIGGKDTTYLVEVRVPKSELMMIFSTHNIYGDYGEVVMTEESLKGYELKIIDFTPTDIEETKSLFLNDKKLRTSLFHSESNQIISPFSGCLDSLGNNIDIFVRFQNNVKNIENSIKDVISKQYKTSIDGMDNSGSSFRICLG